MTDLDGFYPVKKSSLDAVVAGEFGFAVKRYC
jgi:hypothetical protein